MYRFRLIYSLVALALFVGGFLLSFWPLCLLGLVLAAAFGQYPTAVLMGLLMDITYGAPLGRLHFLYAPFTLFSAGMCALHYYLSGYLRRTDSGRL